MRRAAFLIGLTSLILGSALAWTGAQTSGSSQTPLPDRIEEDWQLVVASTDTALNGPQITTTMSPTGDNSSGTYVAFDINYREYPDYAAGGLQLQVFSGSGLLKTSTQSSGQLNTSNETITWTQQMVLNDQSVTYNINNGQSTTWGKFGQGNGLLGVTFNTSSSSLAGYNPQTSAANSAATWMSDHVSSLALVQVRYYSNGQLISTDTTRRDIPCPP